MDIAGGEVRVATEKGCGTTFAMIVPAALSMIRCLLVRCGNQVYAIDAGCLDQSASTANDKLPLLQLGSLLGEDNRDASDEWRDGCLAFRLRMQPATVTVRRSIE